MASSSSADPNSAVLGYAVKQLHVGIIADGDGEVSRNLSTQKLRLLFPDRICTHQLSVPSPWPEDMAVLVVCCSMGLTKETAQWIQSSLQKLQQPEQEDGKYVSGDQEPRTMHVLVWTDYDLDRNLSDRQRFYNILLVNGLADWVPRHVCLLPPEVDVFGRKLVSALDSSEAAAANGNNISMNTSASMVAGANASTVVASPATTFGNQKVFVDRRDQLEINGTVLLKPVLRRPIDPNDHTVTIFYPRSQGGGAKTLQFLDDKKTNVPNFRAHFDPNLRSIACI